MRVVWTLEQWANAVIEMPVAGPLPLRTIIVPNARVGHALCRTLVERGRVTALLGTRFITLRALAAEIVCEAGESALVNEHELGPIVVRQAALRLAREGARSGTPALSPQALDALPELLRELEAAQLDASRLLTSESARVRALGQLFEAVQAQDELRTEASLLRRAREIAGGRARDEATLAVVSGFESGAEAELLRALPAVSLVLWPTRAERERHAERVAALYGAELATLQRASRCDVQGAKLLHRLQRAPFAAVEKPTLHADESVAVEQHADLGAEVATAVAWALREMVEHGVPAQEIAIVSPTPELYAASFSEQLARAAGLRAQELLFVPSGLALADRACGARILLCVRALRDGLPRSTVNELLPRLKGRSQTARVRDREQAARLLAWVETAGGSRENLRAGRAWPEAWEEAVLKLEATGLDTPEGAPLRAQQLSLAGLAPAIEALTDVLRNVIAGEPLSLQWMRLRAFAESHLRLPEAGRVALQRIDQHVALFEGCEESEPCGEQALELLEQALCELSMEHEPYGLPKIYLGALSGLRGLSFRAVRALGMVESSAPDSSQQLLSESERAGLSPLLPTRGDRERARLAAIDDLLRAARERLVLSAPRVDSAGHTCAPHPLFSALRQMVGDGAPAPAFPGALSAADGTSAPAWSATDRRSFERARRPQLAPAVDGGVTPPLGAARMHARSEPSRGATLDRALGLLIAKRAGNVDGATRQAARELGFEGSLQTVLSDVARAHEALQASGLLSHPLRLAYPVSGSVDASTLWVGQVDLCVAAPREAVLIAIQSEPEHRPDGSAIEQLQLAARILRGAATSSSTGVRTALLHPNEGRLRWL